MIQVTEKYYINPTQNCYVVYTKNQSPKYANISLANLSGIDETDTDKDLDESSAEAGKSEPSEKVRKDRILLNPTYHLTLEKAVKEVVKRMEYDMLKKGNLTLDEAVEKVQQVHEKMYRFLAASLTFAPVGLPSMTVPAVSDKRGAELSEPSETSLCTSENEIPEDIEDWDIMPDDTDIDSNINPVIEES